MEKNDLSGGLRVTVIGAVCNVALAVLKFTAGIVGNSSALVVDAVHSLSDLATDVVVYFSLKISSQKPDEGHPYGHGRAETIGGAIIGAAVLFVGIGIVWGIFHKARAGEALVPTAIAIYGAVASIAVKEVLFRYTRYVGEKLRSESIMANAWHHRSDAVSSLAAAVGISGALLGYPLMDPLAAIIVGVMIAGVGWRIFWKGLQNLMDIGVSPVELKEIKKIILEERGVVNYHELKTRRVGKDTFMDVHIQVSPRISISEAHNIAESVRRQLRERLEDVTDALVHIDAENDLDGRHYFVSRQETEEIVKRAVEELSGIEIDGQVILHFLSNKVCVDVTLKFEKWLTAEQARESAGKLTRKLLDNDTITEVTVRQSLGSKAGKN